MREHWNSTSGALLSKETLEMKCHIHAQCISLFLPLISKKTQTLSFIVRVSTAYHMLVKTLYKCQTQSSTITFDSLNLLCPM